MFGRTFVSLFADTEKIRTHKLTNKSLSKINKEPLQQLLVILKFTQYTKQLVPLIRQLMVIGKIHQLTLKQDNLITD